MMIECETYELGAILAALTPLPPPQSAPFVPDYAAFAKALVQELPAQKITCIKLFRMATGWGLKESKDAIEQWAANAVWTGPAR